MTTPHKLTDAQVRELRALDALRRSIALPRLAKRYGVSHGYVKQIVLGIKRKNA